MRGKTQGLTKARAAMQLRFGDRGTSMRKQVGDAESIVNKEEEAMQEAPENT